MEVIGSKNISTSNRKAERNSRILHCYRIKDIEFLLVFSIIVSRKQGISNKELLMER